MANIYIILKNGNERHFLHTGRAGGSYTKEIRYEGAFVVIKDEWYKETAIPAADIAEIRVEPHERVY